MWRSLAHAPVASPSVAADPIMTDSRQQDPDELPDEESSDETTGWFGLSILAWSLIVSVLLHGLAAAPFLVWEYSPSGRFETEWIEQFEELEGLGHGMQGGRWASVEDLPDDEEPEEGPEPEKEPEPEEEPEPKEEPEPEPEDEPEDDPEPEDEPEDEPEPEPEPEPEDEALVAKETAPKPEDTEADNEPAPAEDDEDHSPFRADQPLPGLEREGPTNIPDLKHYGPGNARITALVRMDRLRDTLYEEPVRKVMQAVPDFRILAHSTGFDPIDDIDSFFMASAKPQYVQHTFLAVRHGKTHDEIREVLDRRFRDPIEWETFGEYAVRRLVPESSDYWDPRKIMLAREGLTLVGKDEWLEELAADLPDDSPLRDADDDGDGDGADRPAVQATVLDGLAQIERAAEQDGTMAVLSAQGLVYFLPGLGRMRFEGVRLAVTNPESPTLDLDLKFEDEDEAQKFARSCPMLKARLKKGMGLDGGLASFATKAVGLGDLIDKLQCRADADYVNVRAVYTAQQLHTLAAFAVRFVPRPEGLEDLPPPPPPEPEPEPEEGEPDAGETNTDGLNAEDAEDAKDTK
jgi:hypothetical protein